MNRGDKQTVVDELEARLANATAYYLTDFTGMNVKQMTEFRSRLRKQGVDYVVVKNTLAQRAFATLAIPDAASFFSGPTGLVIGRQDPVAAAKVLTDFAREFDNKPAVKVGIVEGKEVRPEQIKQLALLPSREVLLAQIAGCLQAPMARLAGDMQNLLAGLPRCVDALRQQREASED